MNDMVQMRYGIYDDAPLMDAKLAVEIGRHYVALVTGTSGRIGGFEFFDISDTPLDEALQHIRSSGELLDGQYSESRLYFNLPETVMVPVGRFNSSLASDFLDLSFGERPGYRVNVESVNVSPGIVNVYRSNDRWPEIISRYFRAVTRRHIHSRLAEQLPAGPADILVHFYDTEMRVVASGNQQLQLVRSFDFTGDADILYHLLNVCTQLGFAPENTRLVLAGFLDAGSGASQLLAAHFGEIHWDDSNGIELPAGMKEHPAHYFSPFIKLIA